MRPVPAGPLQIAVINAGAATLKLSLVNVNGDEVTEIHRTSCAWQERDTEAVIREVLAEVAQAPDAIAHRVVHGADKFTEPVQIDADIEAAIGQLSALAPLHNPIALRAIRAARQTFPSVPHFAVFDTAFHAKRLPESMCYALPAELTEPLGIRRYGFHGYAHAALSEDLAKSTGARGDEIDAVTLQLGAGCSACAVAGGRSIETTMGYTPLEGLTMTTRSGNIDPTIVLRLIEAGYTAEDIETRLNEHSGLRALTDHTDMREVLAAESHGDEAARLGLRVFVHHIVMAVGAYFTLLQGRGALVFGGGIGTNSPEIRARIARGLAAWDIVLDTSRNEANRPGAIGRPGHRPVYVFETNEHNVIASDVARYL